MVTRIRRRVTTALAAAILLTTAGCLNVNVDTGDIPPIPDRVVGSTAPPATGYRYTPYGLELRSVLSQQASVEKELAKRDWNELADELGDWQRDVRRLLGRADATHNPALLRQTCDALLRHISDMQRGQRRRDAKQVERGLDAVAPLLDRLSAEFPVTEPIPPGEQTS